MRSFIKAFLHMDSVIKENRGILGLAAGFIAGVTAVKGFDPVYFYLIGGVLLVWLLLLAFVMWRYEKIESLPPAMCQSCEAVGIIQCSDPKEDK